MLAYLRVIPGFGVAVEECRRPELRSHPLILGGLPQQRGVVREANLPAQRFGVSPGMTLAQAHQYCPDGVFLVPDVPHYGAVWEKILDLLRTYTPLVEPVEMGQAVCDLSGCERLWGSARETGSAIALQVWQTTGIFPSIGLAATRIVAEISSLFPGSDRVIAVERGTEERFLAELPVTLLPEVDPQLDLTFRVLGIRTVGQLAALPSTALKGRFGPLGERLHRYARGVDPRPVVPPPVKPSVIVRRDCEEGTVEEATAIIGTLADACAAELQERQLAARLIALTLVWESSTPRATPPPEVPLTPNPSPSRGEGLSDSTRAASPPSPFQRGTRGAGREGRGDEGNPSAILPIAYRIHSMLPQPGTGLIKTRSHQPVPAPDDSVPGWPVLPALLRKERSAVRLPVDSSPALAEHGRRLLAQQWPRGASEAGSRQLQAIELEVSEFEEPAQLSFAEWNRLDQTGALGGLSGDRVRLLLQQEQILAARYGDAAFRHVAQMDPQNLLAERRFRWRSGLPWQSPARRRA